MIAAAVLIAATHGEGDQAVGPAAPDLPAAVMAAMTTVDPAPVPEPAPPGIAFAEVDGVELVLPAAAVIAHGFHEAGSGGPVPLTPIGRFEPGGDTNGFDESGAVVDTSGPHYLVMPTRNRGTAPTGAVDVVLEPGEDVLAPVDGVVTKVADFALYGRHQDTLVHIRPDRAPHLEVKVLHVEGVVVGEGDPVVAGETVVAATARRIPVRNQIDRFVGRALPHVHLEVVPAPANH
jgi:murein DD-endopeptidase MepM/ murein hydrolase activator NlpD